MSGSLQRDLTLLTTEFQDGQTKTISASRVRNVIASKLSVFPQPVNAAGSTLVTATALTDMFNIVTTSGAGQGVSVQASTFTRVWNIGPNPVLVYPPVSTAQFDALGNGVPISVAVGAALDVVMTSVSQGYAR